MFIINRDGSDRLEDRRLWNGNSTNNLKLNEIKYQWAYGLYKQMRENFWIPEKLDLTSDVTDYENLTPDERTAYNGILSYLTFLDSIQVMNLPNIKKRFTAPELHLPLSEQISQECFDDQTEILTNQGWMLFSNINEMTRVAQYNLETEEISFVVPNKIMKYPYQGEMILFESSHTSICVTPNHEMINIHPVTKKKTKRLARQTIGCNYSYPKTGNFVCCENPVFHKIYFLLIAIAADGTIREHTKTNKKTISVQMSLTKQRKKDRLIALLKDLYVSFVMSEKDDSGSTRISFVLPMDITQDTIKSLDFLDITKIDKEIAELLIKEILFWDGDQSSHFYSTNKKAIDKAQIIALIAEKNATVSINRTKEQAALTVLPQGGNPITTKDCYVLSVSNVKYKTYPHQTKKDYDGFVYCVSVPSQNIVTRRNGRIAITGNSMHSQSYQFMIDTIIPTGDRSAVYDLWRTDKVLSDRCAYIASFYQKYEDSKSEEDYFISLVADYLLEGLFFYNGFNFYYNLASRHLMPGSADIFRMINRDELSHVRLFQKIIPEAMQQFSYSEDQIYEIFDKSAEFEIKWTNYICNNQILGITEQSTESYTKYLVNKRLKTIGLKPLYDESTYSKNPYKHLEKFADLEKDGHTKANFFEATVTSYTMSSGINGWDDI
jgi:ribonucleoside-diphosphate reductase beta chain